MESWSEFLKKSGDINKMNFFSFPTFQDESITGLFEQQKQMMEAWKKFAEENAYKFKEFIPNYDEWENLMKNFNPIHSTKSMSKTASEVYDKMINSNNFFLHLYQAWEQAAKKLVNPQSEEFKKNMEKAMEAYDKILLENFIPVMPKELQGLFLNPHKYIKALTKAVGDFYEPWGPISQDLGGIFAEAILKDPGKLSDAIKMWKDGYDKTFGALLKSPVVGSSREIIEQNKKMLDALVSFLMVASDFSTKVMGVASENSKKAFEQYFDMLEEGSEPKTFNEFYKYWSDRVEAAIDKYFFTDEFAKMMGFVADAAMKFKIESDKATELFLANTPIVTTSEIDNVYKNVYELKKEVKKLKKEVGELKKELGAESKGTKNASKARADETDSLKK